jgi:galactokinase
LNDGESPTRDAAIVGFESAYGVRPTWIARAPGRVNLIGEHVDYCGLTVLPMALRRSVWLAFRPVAGPRVRAVTVDPSYGPAEFTAGRSIAPAPAGDWSNYVRAAVQEIADTERLARVHGFDACLATDLPVAAGLSSSSALVVASALASLTANEMADPPRTLLAARLAAAERYVGTAGGGMDQASSLLGREGHAIAIDFDPLRVAPVPIPRDWRIVVGHSGETAEKSGSAQALYNLRTREAAEAAELVFRALAADGPTAGERSTSDSEPPGEGLALYATLLAGHSPEELAEAGTRALDGPPARRFAHITSEAGRVKKAIRYMRAGDLGAVGRLFLASHASLRDDYEVSTGPLDRLVESMCAAGAAGARLTGAGMGGCAIGICRASDVESVLDAARRFEAGRPGPRIAFIAEAGPGAGAIAL